jgi:hypothetical protein
MVLVLLVWLYIFIISTSYGVFFFLFLKKKKLITQSPTLPPIYLLSLTGLCAIQIVACILSIFINIGFVAHLVVCLPAVIGIFVYPPPFSLIYKNIVTQSTKQYLLLVPFVLLGLFLATSSHGYADTPSYHLQSIQWIEKYKVVPGLANLHGRLAFNSALFINSALFTFSFFKTEPLFLLNSYLFGLFVIVTVGYLLKGSLGSVKLFLLLAILTFSVYFYTRFVSSPATDLAAGMYVLFMFYAFTLHKSSVSKGISYTYFAVLLMSICAMTIKLTVAPMALVGISILIFNFKFIRLKHILASAILVLLTILPWLTRNVIMSGFLIYPLYSIDLFDVDWKMPITYPLFDNNPKGYLLSAMADKENIHTWAKMPQIYWKEVIKMSFGEWFPIWLKRQILYVKIMLGLVIFSPILLGVVIWFKNKRGLVFYSKGKYQSLIIFWAVSLITTAYWFFAAPDARFAYSPLMIIAMTGLSICLRYFSPSVFYFLFCTRAKGYIVLAVAFFWVSVIVRTVEKGNIYFENDFIVFPAKTKTYEIEIQKTNSGVEIFTTIQPYEEKVGFEKVCGNTPVPCTPFFNPYLKMRGKTLEEGFRVDKEDIK